MTAAGEPVFTAVQEARLRELIREEVAAINRVAVDQLVSRVRAALLPTAQLSGFSFPADHPVEGSGFD